MKIEIAYSAPAKPFTVRDVGQALAEAAASVVEVAASYTKPARFAGGETVEGSRRVNWSPGYRVTAIRAVPGACEIDYSRPYPPDLTQAAIDAIGAAASAGLVKT